MTEMFTLLNTPDDPAHDAMVEKKSEFIGDACHVDSLDEALAFVETIRERHPSRAMWRMRRSAAGRTAACPSG